MRMSNVKKMFGEGGKLVTVKQRDTFVEGGDKQGERHSKGITPESHD